jgi:hypothetical protein
MSLYADYVRELSMGEVLETDEGFAMYIISDQVCYIKEIYIKPEFRTQKKASDIANSIEAIARENGCLKLLGTVVPSAKTSTASLKVLLAYGFRLQSSQNDLIWFEKDI